MRKILLLFFLIPLASTAQPYIDVASAYFQYSPSDEPKEDKNSVYTQLASVALTAPFKVDSDYIVLNPTYENFKMELPGSFPDRQFHVGILPVSWLHKWENSKWSTVVVFIPRFSAMLNDGISYRDLQYGGAILNSIEKKPTLKIKFGAYYNSEFFRQYFMPLLGIDWNVNLRLNIYGVLPGSMNVEYKLNKIVHTGFIFRSLTNSYRTFGYYFIRVNDYHFKLFIDFYVSKRNVFSIEAGHTALRKYRNGYRITGTPDYSEMNVTDGWLFKVGYAFRIRTDLPNRK